MPVPALATSSCDGDDRVQEGVDDEGDEEVQPSLERAGEAAEPLDEPPGIRSGALALLGVP